MNLLSAAIMITLVLGRPNASTFPDVDEGS